jgi:cytochrome P450
MAQISDPYYDPYDIGIDTDPYPTWKRLRDEAPVYHNEQYEFYALSRHADVQAAHSDTRTYRSGYGNVLELMGDQPLDVPYLVMQDPPRHDTQRALVSRAFTPRRVSVLAGHIRELCAELLDPHVGGPGFDYLQDFAAQLPSRVTSELIGIAAEDREDIRRTIDQTLHIEPGVGIINEVAMAARGHMHAYLTEQIDARRTAPRDDLMTALVEAEMETDQGVRRLTTEEAAAFASELIGAGTETVARLLGWACVLLDANPDQRAILAADLSLVPNAVEETLRYEAPSPVQCRRLVTDVVLHGITVPAGSKVLLLTASAGHDERKYHDPDRFDIFRRIDGHVSFGHGIHFCIGAALARLEARIALEETLRRFPTWEVDHSNAERLHTSTVRGYLKVPLAV